MNISKFFLKVALLFLLVVGLNYILRSFVPYFWHTEFLANYEQLLEEDKNINTLFLGSSRIANGIVPEVFDDEVAKLNGPLVKSFNIAIPGVANGENYRMIHRIINEKKFDNIKYVFLEMGSINYSVGDQFCADKVVHSAKTTYWLDKTATQSSIQDVWNHPFDQKARKRYIQNYLVGFLQNQFNAGYYESFLDFYYKRDIENFGKGTRESNGYRNAEKSKSRLMKKNRKDYVQSDGKLSKAKAQASRKVFSGEYDVTIKNQQNLDHLHQLIETAKAQKVHLFFHIPPLVNAKYYPEIVALYRKLPDAHKLQTSNVFEFPELYEMEYIYDGTHLKEKGAALASQYLAQKFVHFKYNKGLLGEKLP